MRYFFYGSLMDPTIASIVLDRPIGAQDFQPATLTGFITVRVRDEHYPALVRSRDRETAGVLVSDVSAIQAKRLQFYETTEFHQATVEVVTADGARIETLVFMPAATLQCTDEPWHFENFLERAGPEYFRHTRQWMEAFGHTSQHDMQDTWRGT